MEVEAFHLLRVEQAQQLVDLLVAETAATAAQLMLIGVVVVARPDILAMGGMAQMVMVVVVDFLVLVVEPQVVKALLGEGVVV